MLDSGEHFHRNTQYGTAHVPRGQCSPLFLLQEQSKALVVDKMEVSVAHRQSSFS